MPHCNTATNQILKIVPRYELEAFAQKLDSIEPLSNKRAQALRGATSCILNGSLEQI